MSALFSPYKLAGLELANRLVVSPMCQYSGDDGCANDWHLMHLGMLANSGAALVIVEATHVERHGRITHGCLGLYNDDNEADMERVRQAFVSAVKRALRIGFDEIELHMAHGYLAHGFMSPVSNKRTDQYGGSLDNRLKFPLSIARAVRAVVPRDIPLGARITGSDW